MYVQVDEGGARLLEADDLGRFHVVVAREMEGPAVEAALAPFGRLDDDHAWITLDALRDAAAGAVEPDWEARLSSMLEYAGSKGWLSDDGGSLRAHIVEGPGPGEG